MKHLADKRSLPDASRLMQFLRIERQQTDALLRATIHHPKPRTDSNARVVAYCRIDRGQEA